MTKRESYQLLEAWVLDVQACLEDVGQDHIIGYIIFDSSFEEGDICTDLLVELVTNKLLEVLCFGLVQVHQCFEQWDNDSVKVDVVPGVFVKTLLNVTQTCADQIFRNHSEIAQVID